MALISLLTRRPRGHPRLWCAALIAVSLGAGMAALHPVVRMAEDLIATVRLLLVTPEDGEAGGRRRSSRPDSWDGSPVPRPPAAALEAKVPRLLRANPHATWRVVRDRTGLSEANAKRTLTAARRQLQRSSQEVGEAAGA